LIAAFVATLIFTAPHRATGDITYRGTLGPVKTTDFPGPGTHEVYTAKDPAGDTFTENVVDGIYFQGHIHDASTSKDFDFGCCTYKGGLNFIFADTNITNSIVEVGWLNLDPASLDGNSTDPLQRKPNESVSDWIKRITPLIMSEHLSVHIYDALLGDLNPDGTQTVTTYVNGVLKDPSFPASLAGTYYLPNGDSVDPYLQIDPEMRIPGISGQDANGAAVPEPSSLILLSVGAVALLAYLRWGIKGSAMQTHN
jgi:hypothetical protein